MKNNKLTKFIAIFLSLSVVIFTALTGCKKDEPVNNPDTETTTNVSAGNAEDTTKKEDETQGAIRTGL